MTGGVRIRGFPAQGCVPWERHLLTPEAFAALAAAPEPALLGLWAEPGLVHAAFLDEAGPVIASVPAPDGHYPALAPAHPGATPFERAVHDLWGLSAQTASGGAVDRRPWLDHGRWPVTAPLSAEPAPRLAPPGEPPLLPAGAEGLHQVPVGPVRPGEGPAHLRLTVLGETVLRLEARLGYAHKGTLSLMRGRSPRAASRFAARIEAGATVAHAWAFAMAAEAATATPPPPRALALRGAMAELERIASHLRQFGAVCTAAGLDRVAARCGVLREALLRANATAFGHRLMMDCVIPGGVQPDVAPDGAEALLVALRAVEAELGGLASAADRLQGRLAGVARVPPELAARLALGGPVGRASGRRFDARGELVYAPYAGFAPVVPASQAGDAAARLTLLLAELGESLALAQRMLPSLPEGETLVPLPQRGGEGLGCVEGPGGEILAWMALDDGGLIRAAFSRDPAWLRWPLLEAVAPGVDLADMSLLHASLGPNVSGVDL